MRELDSLLDDLNRSRLSAGLSSSSVGHNSSGGNSNDGRPSVDALLNELSNAVHKYLIILRVVLSLFHLYFFFVCLSLSSHLCFTFIITFNFSCILTMFFNWLPWLFSFKSLLLLAFYRTVFFFFHLKYTALGITFIKGFVFMSHCWHIYRNFFLLLSLFLLLFLFVVVMACFFSLSRLFIFFSLFTSKIATLFFVLFFSSANYIKR